MPGAIRQKRQWARRVVLLAVAGLLLQVVLVVWRVRHHRLGPVANGLAPVALEDGRTRKVVVRRTWAATDCVTETFLWKAGGGIGSHNAAERMAGRVGPTEFPAWCRAWTDREMEEFLKVAEGLTPPQVIPTVTIVRAGLGWPFRAFRGDRVYAGAVGIGNGGSYWSPNGAFSSPGYVHIGAHAYPLAPIWLGLMADVSLVVGPGLLVLSILDACRWHARRRAGRCPVCRYDLVGLEAGTPCPECGWTEGAAR